MKAVLFLLRLHLAGQSLEKEQWPGSRAAFFNTEEFALDICPAEKPDVAQITCSNLVSVIRDQSTGVGKDRCLFWEVTALDPRVHDILEEMAQIETGSQTRLSRELNQVL